MKKLVSYVAIAAFMFSINAFAGVHKNKKRKKKKLKLKHLQLKIKKNVEPRKKVHVALLKKLKIKKHNTFFDFI